jgi:hypothetical protein
VAVQAVAVQAVAVQAVAVQAVAVQAVAVAQAAEAAIRTPIGPRGQRAQTPGGCPMAGR